MSYSVWSRVPRDTRLSREGVITGLLGAAVVAVFYLVVDIARGHPFMTPSVLGDAFILHRPMEPGVADPLAIVVYTIVHLVAFTLFGLALAALARACERSALARYAMVQMLVVFTVFFCGVVFIGSELVRGMFPLIGVLLANACAGAMMVTWLWRHHPRVRVALTQTPLGAGDSGL